MRDFALAVLLIVVVLSTWLGCVGFVRLRTAIDRLHCVTFVNASAGLALVAAAFVQDGLTTRTLKLLALVLLILVMGAAMSHATGRALWLRDGSDR